MIQQAKKLVTGHGAHPKTDLGPLIHVQQKKKVLQYIQIGKKEGAKLVLGGKALVRGAFSRGHFIEPTIFANVLPSMRIAQEEIFGPVVCLIPFKDMNEAMTIANDVRYGLSSSFYSKDTNQAFKAIRDLEAGMTYINSPSIGAEVHLPFGGVKDTGSGHREAGVTGLDIFSEWKTVYVDYSAKLQKAQVD